MYLIKMHCLLHFQRLLYTERRLFTNRIPESVPKFAPTPTVYFLTLSLVHQPPPEPVRQLTPLNEGLICINILRAIDPQITYLDFLHQQDEWTHLSQCVL